jgi:decaprenyl-phosphate phosphoribosyltransferase
MPAFIQVDLSATRGAAFLRALRPTHWLKNVLVFAAPGAAGVLGRPEILARSCLAFVSMCFVASATYLVNDVVDAESDRRHPVRRRRAIASGTLSERSAVFGSLVLFVVGIALSATLGGRFLAVVLVYIAVTISYSLWLQRIAVIDLVAVASGFVLRAIAGGAATHVAPSAWFLILTCSGALFVVAGKRLADEHTPTSDGSSTGRYPVSYLRGVWVLAGSVAITAYALWAFAVPHLVDGVAWSQVSIVPFAVALLRYAYVIELGDGGAPERVFVHDRVLEAIVLVWLVTYALGVYLT